MTSNQETSLSPFARYVSAASLNQRLWRFILGVFLIAIIWIALSAFFFAVIPSIDASSGGQFTFFSDVDFDPINTPGEVFLLLSTFSFVWLGLWLVVKFIHRQTFSSLFSSGDHHKLKNFLSGAAVVFIVIISSVLFLPFTGGAVITEAKPGIDLSVLLILLPFLLIFTFIQIAAEELFFRGYMLQQLASRYQSWLVWALIPSLLFGFAHYESSSSGYTPYLYVLATVIIGLVACCLVWRTGSLWSAIGMHMTNNFFAFSVLGIEDYLSGTSLWIIPRQTYDDLIIYSVIVWTIVLILVVSPLGKRLNAQ